MNISKKLIIISISLVILTMLVYAERVKIRTIQHRPVGGFVKFETLGDTTLQEVTIGKKATTSGTQIKLTDDMYIGSTSDTAVLTAKDFVVNGSMTVVGDMVANSSFNITGTSTFIGATSFDGGLDVSDDLYVIGTFTATGLATGNSFTKVSGGEFKVDTLRSESTEIDGHSFPVPSTTNATWQTITYQSNEEPIHVIGSEEVITTSDLTDWANDVNDCSGDHDAVVSDVATFCDGKAENYTCNDRYRSEVLDETEFASSDSTNEYHFSETCPSGPTLYYPATCPSISGKRVDRIFPSINGGCPAIGDTNTTYGYNCEDLCEDLFVYDCNTNEFFLYTNQSGEYVAEQDSGSLWYDPEHWYQLLSNGSGRNHADKVYVKINESVVPRCTGGLENVFKWSYKVIKCLPERKEPMTRTLTCNVPTTSTRTATVLGY